MSCGPVHHVAQIDHKHSCPRLYVNPGLAKAYLQSRLVVCSKYRQGTPVRVRSCTRTSEVMYHARAHEAACACQKHPSSHKTATVATGTKEEGLSHQRQRCLPRDLKVGLQGSAQL